MADKLKNTRPQLVFLGMLVLFFFLLLANVALGSLNIPIKEALKEIIRQESQNEVWHKVIVRTRFPQILVAVGAGMALGVSGLFMQTLFRNPLAGPSVLGISSGSSLGVAFVILVAGRLFNISFTYSGIWGEIAVIVAAMLGALSILMIILLVSRKLNGTLGVLILGVMFGYLANSLVGIFKYYSFEEDVHSYVIWGLGSFNRLSVEKAKLFALLTIIPSIASLLLAKPLNLLALGDNYARNLGLNIKRSRTLIIFVAGILTALVAAFCGPIIFIGLAVPHLTKMLTQTSNHFYLIINTTIIGATIALFCNLVARMPGSDMSLPINSVTAFVGAPVVISVIWKRRKEQLLDG